MSDTIKSKRCSHCKKIKSVSEFNKNRSRKDGYDNQCKKCHQEYRQAHRIEISRRHKKYYKQHRTERLQYCKEYRKEYYQAHRVEYLENHKKYRNTLQGHLWRVWYNMLRRCNNPKAKDYKYYGGRGIKVKFACFDDFFNHVVKELKADPRDLTIDRTDNNGHYEPGNIRFVTMAENNRNKRRKYHNSNK